MLSPEKGVSMTTRQRYSTSSILKRLSLFVVTLTLLLPCNVFADSFLLVRIVDELDLAKLATLKDVKLSAVVKMDGKGDLVVSCLNLSLPVAHNPFNDIPGMQKLLQRTRLQVDPKGRGVMVKIAFAF
jgi:hypothetical protein